MASECHRFHCLLSSQLIMGKESQIYWGFMLWDFNMAEEHVAALGGRV